MDNIELYNSIFIETFGVEKNELNDDFSFGRIKAWDSLAHISLITELEFAFDIMFATEDILNFGSYENGKMILGKYGVDMEG